MEAFRSSTPEPFDSSQSIAQNTPPRGSQGSSNYWANLLSSPVRPYGLVTPPSSPERNRSQLAPLASHETGLLYQTALPSISAWRPEPAGALFNGADISAVHLPHDPSWMVPPPLPLTPRQDDPQLPRASGGRRSIELEFLVDAALHPGNASSSQEASRDALGDSQTGVLPASVVGASEDPMPGVGSLQEIHEDVSASYRGNLLRVSPPSATSPPSAEKANRLRRKRVQGEAALALTSRRLNATLERKRRSKTCCIFYEASNCVHEVVGKLSEGRDQFASVILRISHFPGESGEGTWVVFFVKEAIPYGPWDFIRGLTDGVHLVLNPPIDKSKKLVTSFGGVIQNFPFVTEQLLGKNALECHMLPQPRHSFKGKGRCSPQDQVDDSEAQAGSDSHEPPPVLAKRLKKSALPDAFSIFHDFLNKGRPASVAEYDKFVINTKHFLQFMPGNQGRFASALLDGLQLEHFAQAMTLQSSIVTHLVDCFGFPRRFTRLSMQKLESPWECMARLHSDELRTSLAALMETQEKVFAFNITLMDCTSVMFLVSVQLIQKCGGLKSLGSSESQEPLCVEAARMMAYDLVGLAGYIKQLADFAGLLGITAGMDERLLQVPDVPKLFTDLAPPGSSLRSSFVKSHRMALNGLILKLGTVAELESKPALQKLHRMFTDMQDSAPFIKHATLETKGFTMLRASSFAREPDNHLELVQGFVNFLDQFKDSPS